MTATKRSVVGSGPTRIPGNSLPTMYLMNDVLPVEYWPTMRTLGLLSNSLSVRGGE